MERAFGNLSVGSSTAHPRDENMLADAFRSDPERQGQVV